MKKNENAKVENGLPVIASENGALLTLFSAYYTNGVIKIRFSVSDPDAKVVLTSAEVNGKILLRDQPLCEDTDGYLLLILNLKKAPANGYGFENMYDIRFEIENFSSGGTFVETQNTADKCTEVNILYDISKNESSCISIDGKMLPQGETDLWNKYVKNMETQTPLEILLSELDQLPGLQEVKYEIRSAVNMNRLMRLRKDRGLPAIDMSLHMVFTGNPGTGKTTLARLLAKIYKEAGILTRGQFIEADRASLVSNYIGGTALKVKRVVESAIGGILFIDEAYSLSDGQDGKDYGKEAITTLLKEMEDHRDDLIVIVAGYPDKMEQFLNSNPGFRSRFNRFVRFRDYTPTELTDIFLYECRKYRLNCETGIPQMLTDYFENLIREKDPYFANGRTVRNIFEQTLMNQANRFEDRSDMTDEELVLLITEDLPAQILRRVKRRRIMTA